MVTRPAAPDKMRGRPVRAVTSRSWWEAGGSTRLEPHERAALAAKYGLEVDPQSVPELVSRFELVFPGEPL